MAQGHAQIQRCSRYRLREGYLLYLNWFEIEIVVNALKKDSNKIPGKILVMRHGQKTQLRPRI